MKSRFILTSLLCLAFANSYAETWTRTAMGGGGAFSMVVSTKDGTLLAGADLSGVYQSTDGGSHWSVIGSNNGLLNSSVEALGVDPNSNKAFIGTLAGLYTYEKDQAGKVTITPPTDLTKIVESIAVAKSDSDYVYAAQYDWDGVFSTIHKSTDGGQSWSDLNGFPKNKMVIKLLVHPADKDVVYALTGKARYNCSAAQLYRSYNGGNSWERVATNLPDLDSEDASNEILDFDLDPTNVDTVYVSTFKSNGCNAEIYDYAQGDSATDGAFYKVDFASQSNDEENISVISKRTGIISVGVGTNDNPVDEMRLINFLYFSDWSDEAGTWEKPAGQNEFVYKGRNWDKGSFSSDWLIFTPSYYGLSKTVTKDIFNGDRLYSTFGQSPGISTNGGINFNLLTTKHISGDRWRSTGLDNINVTSIAVNESNPDVVYVGGYDVGFWVSKDHGASWERTQPNFNHKDASGNYDYRKYVWNIGNSPSENIAKHGDGSSISTLLNDPTRENVVWASFSELQYDAKSGLFRSTDYGKNWTLSTFRKNGNKLSFNQTVRVHGLSIDKDSTNNNRTLYVTVKGDVYKSTDDGKNWNSVFLNGGLKFTAVGKRDHAGQKMLFAGGENGLYRSFDNGDNWEKVGGSVMEQTAGPHRTDVAPTYPDWVGGTEIKAWDGVFDIEIDKNNPGRVYVTVHGKGKGLYRSDDAGNTWKKIFGNNGNEDFMRGLKVAPNDSNIIYVSSSEAYSSGLTATTSSGVHYSTDAGETWHSANDGSAWNFAANIVIESGDNPNIWALIMGTGPQYTPIASDSVNPHINPQVSPKGNISDTTPVYKWKIIDGAASYALQIENTQTATIINTYDITPENANCANAGQTCEFTPVDPLIEGSQYVWRIMAKDANGSGEYLQPGLNFHLVVGSAYEDAEDGSTDRWVIFDETPAGAKVTNEYDSSKQSKVISFKSKSTRNGFRIGNHAGRDGAWNNTSQKVISWDIKASNRFIIYVTVDTTLGQRYIVYTTSNKNYGVRGKNKNYIIYGLGSDLKNGKWHTLFRDLEADLRAYEPNNQINSVNGFLIRGTSKLDNITLLNNQPDTVYEDAKDGKSDGWVIYDEKPSGATISNVLDPDTNGRVIKLQGSGTKNGYRLGNKPNKYGAWNNTSQKTISWSSKFSEKFSFYIRVSTPNGKRYLVYTPVNNDLGKSKSSIHLGLGVDAKNGQWHNFTHDLENDLQKYEPSNSINTVDGFYIRGSGSINNIKLMK